MVVFFGSPDFAVPSLKKLSQTEYRPALIVTQPDKPSGRGRRTLPTPVRAAAEELGIPFRTAGTLKDGEIEGELARLKPDFFVVAAFGLIFPGNLLDMPEKGCINLHGSLLPSYRGASPVNMAVKNGDLFTGVTTMEMVKEVDAGPLYLQDIVPIGPLETAGEVFDKLAGVGAGLLIDTLRAIDREGIKPVPQQPEGISYAPMMKKSDGLIPWELDSVSVHNHIRGMNPWPGSFTYYSGRYIKVLHAEPADLLRREERPGTVVRSEGTLLKVACGRGTLRVIRLQVEGRRPQDTEDFLRGFDIDPGSSFSNSKKC